MKRILITRTDRIGDVAISTPVFKAVREAYPKSHIAVIVRPYAKDVVDGNPYIDEVILYDKYGKHKTIIGSTKFTLMLLRKKFELAIVLHPTNRMHIITFLACIPNRVGFRKKSGYLLTKAIIHNKQLGLKHELEYTLDVIKAIGVPTANERLYFPVKRDTEKQIKESLKSMGVVGPDKLIAIHAAASCASKRWPVSSFARLADELIIRYGARIVVVSSPGDSKYAKDMIKEMRHDALDFSGKTTVGELGALIKQCALLISNDSGPVHIAVSVGTPVISIFGRKNAGLGPERWKPLGEEDIIFHKNVGCPKCLAHNCNNKFKCLTAISVAEVLEASGKILKDSDLKSAIRI